MTQLATARISTSAQSWPIAAELRPMCIRALRRMYDPDINLFCHCIRRGPDGDIPEGVSHRYTAITMIGLLAQETDVCKTILGERGRNETLERLIQDVPFMNNLGDVALTLWMLVAAKHRDAKSVLEQLHRFDPANQPHPTVEIAWTLTSLSIDPAFLSHRELASALANRLQGSYSRKSNLFSHWVGPAQVSAWRSHVTCFADWVYPVQALSHYHMATDSKEAIAIARTCAANMRRLQGSAGQWWWHYDARTGAVVEPYPVYAVHQDAMAPMAFFALEEACGDASDEAIQLGLEWLVRSAERCDSLIDHEADLIWRKVARREPAKLVRGAQAVASAIHPSLRAPFADTLFPPTAIDYECRPYHLGWLLYAFDDRRTKATVTSRANTL